MAIHAATTGAASVARRAPCAAGKHLGMLLRGVGDWRLAECAAAAGAPAPRSPRTRPASPRPLTPRCCAHSPFAVLPKRSDARAYLRAAPRRPMAAAAAAPAAAAHTATTSQQRNNTLPFVRPGSAGWPCRDPMYKWDQLLPEPWVELPASGLDCAPLMAPARPTTYGACTGDAWASPATFIDLNAGVSPCFAGMTDLQWRKVRGVMCAGGVGRPALPSVCRSP